MRAVNPFSAQRAASSDAFIGYSGASLGGWKLDEIINCWLQCDDGVPSFWAIGERKLGKTSLLLRLENLLSLPRVQDAPRRALPLYINCHEITTLADFYRQLFARAVQILSPEDGLAPVLDTKELSLLQPKPAELSPFEMLGQLIENLGNLVAQFSPDESTRARIVLLIDDVETAARGGWTATLFEHLRALLRRRRPSKPEALRREDIALVIAGGRYLEKAAGARDLLELLEELPLHALDKTEVANLVTQHCEKPQRQFWPHRIYKGTAGHPWLVQFVMENIVASATKSIEDQNTGLEAILKTGFADLESGMGTFRHYLDSLLDRSVEIIGHLALSPDDVNTVETLAAKTRMSPWAVMKRLEQMLNFGIVCDSQEPQSRYFLCEIFKYWFLAHTGSGVFLSEVEQLRSAATREKTQLQVLNAPFTLTLGINPAFLLADGLYTRLLRLERDPSKTLSRVSKLVSKEGEKDLLDFVAEDLKEALQQSEWEAVWNDYVEKAPSQGREARFVLRVKDEALFDFPIEILVFKEPLGLERPVYKELMTEQREPAYRLSRNLLPSEELNVLVVGSSRGGITEDGLQYADLPLVPSEVVDICRTLRADGEGRRLKIGRITALVETDETLPPGVRKEAPTLANVTRALRGELGGPFHLFHFCGHYIPNRSESAGGFLFADGKSLERLNLVQWRNALANTQLRLVCLNACGSGVHVPEASLYHLGAAHVALMTRVPVVIGMRWNVRDTYAHSFSESFYPHLLQSGVPEVALHETRKELQGKNSASTHWAAPVMLTR